MEPKARSLEGLWIAQFFGAFNDNAWKIIVTLLALRTLEGRLGADGGLEAAAQTQTTLAFLVFTVPLMLFSLPASVLADRVSKRTLIVALKGLEVVLMAAGAAVLFAAPAGGPLALAVLGLMGVQSALFSPAKYGILPEVLPHDRLSAANGALEMGTFLAIILGTAAGGLLLEHAGSSPGWAAVVLVALSLLGLTFSRRIPRVAAAAPAGRGRRVIREAWSALRGDRRLWLAVCGATFFWALVSLMGQDLFVYGKTTLGLGDEVAGFPAALFGVGVGLGCYVAGRLSRGKVETGLIPLGAAGLAGMTALLAVLEPDLAGTLVLMAALGLASGLVIVPLDALLQWRSPAHCRGAVIALSNVLVFGGMLVGSLGATALARMGLAAAQIFTAAAVACAVGLAWALWLLPHAGLRLLLVLLTQTVYRLRVRGATHVPERGAALLVPNHVSFLDWAFVIASTDRQVRFLVERDYYDRRLFRPFLRLAGAIPISSREGPRAVLRSLREAGRYLDDGEVVCIFAEGEITRTGGLLPFRRGLEVISRGRDVPIVPVHLDRLWGSVFSFAGGRPMTRLPSRLPYPVTVSFGEPLPSGTPLDDVRQAVAELGAHAWRQRTRCAEPLHRRWVRRVRRGPLATAFLDAGGKRHRRLGALAGAVALARALRPALGDDERVGVALPTSTPGALANIALGLSGRVAVNLNYTVGRAAVASAVKQAAIRNVVTSRAFVEKTGLELPAGVTPVWLEDVAGAITALERLTALALAALVPARRLERACGARRPARAEDVAAIIFSSGSTGDPKGVLLTHANLAANVEQVSQVVHLRPDDRLLGALPLFHSFGTMSLWFAALTGTAIVFTPDPLDAAAVGDAVAGGHVTVMLATPTFLQLYLRRCPAGQLGSLRLVISGAEKLAPSLAQAFEDEVGTRPLEGYGATECSPVIALNTPSYRAAGFCQPGARAGTVGRPLPGVAVRIVDPDTRQPRPRGEDGLLLVKGPNVMAGYLGRDDLTREALHDGWYATGDLARLDEAGFITITDRLARFSKIGGEMVPHGRIEEALHAAAGVAAPAFAVTAVPDGRKGERLAVLHTVDPDRVPALRKALAAGGLPNLFIPRADCFIPVAELPRLGTGKTDLRQVRAVACETLATAGV